MSVFNIHKGHNYSLCTANAVTYICTGQDQWAVHTVQSLNLALKDISYIIVDAMSMVGQRIRILAYMDKGKLWATGQLVTPLGLSVILLNDSGQLLVGDTKLRICQCSHW